MTEDEPKTIARLHTKVALVEQKVDTQGVTLHEIRQEVFGAPGEDGIKTHLAKIRSNLGFLKWIGGVVGAALVADVVARIMTT